MVDEQNYSLAEVLQTERVAWASSTGAVAPDYYFDGVNFFRLDPEGRQWMVRLDEAPANGWWHKATCNCSLCRQRVVG
jgi:hypothetical protein